MKTIGLLYGNLRSDSMELARRAERLLQAGGARTWTGTSDDLETLCAVASDLELLMTFGGDGTIVNALRSVSAASVPVLGVNLGRLGFLAEIEPEALEAVIPDLLAQRFFIEERMMIQADLYRDNACILSGNAINEVVMGRGGTLRAVRISVYVDGHYVMTQTADGLVVATPTGSTAYCLSAGGPIVSPGVNGITLVPVAAHLAVAHAIVVPANSTVKLVLDKGVDALMTMDGQVDADIEVGDAMVIRAADTRARFIRFGSPGYFYETVLHRLRWPDLGPSQ